MECWWSSGNLQTDQDVVFIPILYFHKVCTFHVTREKEGCLKLGCLHYWTILVHQNNCWEVCTWISEFLFQAARRAAERLGLRKHMSKFTNSLVLRPVENSHVPFPFIHHSQAQILRFVLACQDAVMNTLIQRPLRSNEKFGELIILLSAINIF